MTKMQSAHGRASPVLLEEGGAVFLDRDGVIAEQSGYVNQPADLVLMDDVAEAIGRLNRAGIPVIVVTNQGGVGMGYLTEEALARIHDRLELLLAQAGAHVDAIYYCPHMADARLETYRLDCPCRKPNPGMLERAHKEFGIDLRASVMVGDATTDILAGQRAVPRLGLQRSVELLLEHLHVQPVGARAVESYLLARDLHVWLHQPA